MAIWALIRLAGYGQTTLGEDRGNVRGFACQSDCAGKSSSTNLPLCEISLQLESVPSWMTEESGIVSRPPL
jgi:hypothetical protein